MAEDILGNDALRRQFFNWNGDYLGTPHPGRNIVIPDDYIPDEAGLLPNIAGTFLDQFMSYCGLEKELREKKVWVSS